MLSTAPPVPARLRRRRSVSSPVATRSASSASEGATWPPLSATSGMRRTTSSWPATMLKPPSPDAPASSSARLSTLPANCGTSPCRSPPTMANDALGLTVRAVGRAMSAKPKVTPPFAIASAKMRSLSGNATPSVFRRSRALNGSFSIAAAGEAPSGSAKTMSKAIDAAPRSRRRSTSAASVVLGHGHCPYSARLASSISTTVTGVGGAFQGKLRCNASKAARRNRSNGAGLKSSAAAMIKMVNTPAASGENSANPRHIFAFLNISHGFLFVLCSAP